MSSAYLGSQVMKATSSTMALASSILGFDIVELWSEGIQGQLHCTYIHVDENLQKTYPEIIVGHYPNHKNRVHKYSPTLCQLAKESTLKYHWRVVPATGEVSTESHPLYEHFSAPVKTEMAYMIQGETEGANVFIVGFAVDKIAYGPSKLKFLSGLGYAIYVAAFDLDEDEDSAKDEQKGAELDIKEFMPRPLVTPFSSMANLSGISGSGDLGMGVWAPQMPDLALLSNDTGEGITMNGESLSDEGDGDYCVGNGATLDIEGSSPTALRVRTSSSGSMGGRRLSGDGNLKVKASPLSPLFDGVTSFSLPPTWDPVDAFSFPVAEIPPVYDVADNLTLNSFTELKHIADGSNSNIFLGLLNGEKVIVKLIKEDVQTDTVAVHEFDVEHGMLSRISHPNIIRLMGAGRIPRRFIVLEYLGGGSLNTILSQNQAKPGIAQRLFRKPSFTYPNLLSKARDMAEALDFLHSRCHPGAAIIHRDLKPDNVGFTASGTLKLFDFGLCTCVRKREQPNIAYEMTGNTGSLRYMAPEVALRKPYTEKVDVYSFGIMVWQMARDRVPFKGMSRDDFLQTVVYAGERPKLDKSWPTGFSALLTSCWQKDALRRPSFSALVKELTRLMEEAGGGASIRTWTGQRLTPLALSGATAASGAASFSSTSAKPPTPPNSARTADGVGTTSRPTSAGSTGSGPIVAVSAGAGVETSLSKTPHGTKIAGGSAKGRERKSSWF